MTDGRYDKAVLCGRVDPSGRDIRLNVEGMDWQVAEAGTALRRLTALPARCKDDSGDVAVPLTWAMVTQLAALMTESGCGWRPDPGLNQWIGAEFLRRHDEGGDLKFDVSSLNWTPMPHQLAGAYVGALNKRFFFCDDLRPQPVDTPILTTRGWKTLGALKPGAAQRVVADQFAQQGIPAEPTDKTDVTFEQLEQSELGEKRIEEGFEIVPEGKVGPKSGRPAAPLPRRGRPRKNG